jgi:hypothetical protein
MLYSGLQQIAFAAFILTDQRGDSADPNFARIENVSVVRNLE